MLMAFDTQSSQDYKRFLAVKSLPRYTFRGVFANVPDEYAHLLGRAHVEDTTVYHPIPGLFDYQRDIAAMAIRKRRYAVFADCGLGKTLIMAEFVRHARANLPASRSVLIVSPLMVIPQTIAEFKRWYPDAPAPQRIHASQLADWTENGSGVGITNYDALHEDIPQGKLGALILDESSMLKSHYGAWGQSCIRLGKGLEWKLCLTGTPAPNDRIEYANHAVFLDKYPTVNAFLARFFVNRGQTDNRWELKPHALGPFYRSLSDWSIFLTNPGVYGWKDNCADLPPIIVNIEDVSLTTEQRSLVQDRTGALFASEPGGIVKRSALAQIGKGFVGDQKVSTNKPDHIRRIVESHRDESIIIWCHYNREQETLAAMMPDAANITGATPDHERERLIDGFKAGKIRVLITKPRILGFGLNLQIASRHIFSGLQDSYEEYYQAVKRSNRYGSTKPLHVHIPVTEIERPMIDTVLRKATRIVADTIEQERIFRDASRI